MTVYQATRAIHVNAVDYALGATVPTVTVDLYRLDELGVVQEVPPSVLVPLVGVSAASSADVAAATAVEVAARNAAIAAQHTVDNGTYAPAGISAAIRSPFAPLIDSLRLGYSCSLGLLGDSTGDAVDEWFYMMGQWLAPQFPAFTVERRAWNDTLQEFDRPAQIQAGTAGGTSYITTSNGAANWYAAAIVGDIDIRVKCAATNWTSTQQTMTSQFGGSGNRGWRFYLASNGKVSIDWCADGATILPQMLSTVAVPFANGVTNWVRVVLDVDNGAAGRTATFYTSTDAVTWTVLGAPVVQATGVTSIFNSTWPYEIGARTGSSEPFAGNIYEVEIRDGIGGGMVTPSMACRWVQPSAYTFATVGAPVLTMWSGSMSGAGLTYLNDPVRLPKMLPKGDQSLVFLSDGHNESSVYGSQFLASYKAWVDAIQTRLPYVLPIVLTQNPRKSPASNIIEQAQRRSDLLKFVGRYQLPLIDTYKAFLATAGGYLTLINSDGIHPSQGPGATGSQKWTDTVTAEITKALAAP